MANWIPLKSCFIHLFKPWYRSRFVIRNSHVSGTKLRWINWWWVYDVKRVRERPATAINQRLVLNNLVLLTFSHLYSKHIHALADWGQGILCSSLPASALFLYILSGFRFELSRTPPRNYLFSFLFFKSFWFVTIRIKRMQRAFSPISKQRDERTSRRVPTRFPANS